jgi:hypothetical protein
MAAVETACGSSHVESRVLSFTKADKDRILQNFPEKIAVSVSGFGGQEFPLRPYIKAILDQIQPPAVKITIAVRGEPDDVDSIEIDDILLKVTGATAGTFKIGDTAIAYSFDADILPGETVLETCECEEGGEGHRKSRTFACTWDIEISVEPGIAGVYEIEEFEITVASPCICPGRAFEVDESEDGEFEDERNSNDDHGDDDGHGTTTNARARRKSPARRKPKAAANGAAGRSRSCWRIHASKLSDSHISPPAGSTSPRTRGEVPSARGPFPYLSEGDARRDHFRAPKPAPIVAVTKARSAPARLAPACRPASVLVAAPAAWPIMASSATMAAPAIQRSRRSGHQWSIMNVVRAAAT